MPLFSAFSLLSGQVQVNILLDFLIVKAWKCMRSCKCSFEKVAPTAKTKEEQLLERVRNCKEHYEKV